VKAPYDSFDYPEFWKGREYEDRAERIALEKLLSKIPQKGSLIDIGGGFGRLAQIYAPEFKKCLLVDPSEKHLNLGQKNLKNFKNLQFKKGIGENLPVKDATFDVVLMVRVVHHLPDPEKTFREASRVLKPSGYFVLEFANKIHFLARLRAFLKGNFNFASNLQSLDQRSPASLASGTIPLFNHHPKFILERLEKANFQIISLLSVSNFRHPILKKIIPLPILVFLEKYFSLFVSHFSFLSYFGPSIFILCQKKE